MLVAGKMIKSLKSSPGVRKRYVRQFIAGKLSCLVGLWDTPGRGVKQRWQEADLAYLEQALQQEQRTYNSRQLAEKLRRDLRSAAALRYREIHLSPDRIRRVLKKRGGCGNVPLISHRRKHNLEEKAVKLADASLTENS